MHATPVFLPRPSTLIYFRFILEGVVHMGRRPGVSLSTFYRDWRRNRLGEPDYGPMKPPVLVDASFPASFAAINWTPYSQPSERQRQQPFDLSLGRL